MAFEDLIEDLILQILLRLPVKSIVRFKIVSKRWLSILSSPLFRRIHASRSIGQATGVFFKKTWLHEFLPLIGGEITTRNLPGSIISSSGGLLLLQSGGFQDYIVCNPTTNDFKLLPLAPPIITASPIVLPYLAFDPRKSPRYKILFLCSDKRFEYVIYSSETEGFSSPKQLPVTSLKYSKSLIYGGYCNNAMHWILDESFYYFNLDTEIMKQGPLPNGLRDCKCFGESRGHLILMAVCRTGNYFYELKSDYSGWSVKFRISRGLFLSKINKFLDGADLSSRIRFKVLSIIVDREDEENIMLVLIACGYFAAYNCKLEQFVMLGGGYQVHELRDYHIRRSERFRSWQYIETLACV